MPEKNRHFLFILSAVLLLALSLRILALFSLKKSIYFDFLLFDEKVYHTMAMKIVDGSYQSSSVYEFSPLPIYVMAFLYKMISPDIFLIRILNILFGVVTCYFIYLIGKEMRDRATGLLACLVAALYNPFIFYSIVPLKTAMSVMLFAFTVYLFLSLLGKDSMIRTLLLGMVAGLLLNVRPNTVVLIPVMLLVILWNLHRVKALPKTLIMSFVLYLTGLSLSLSPFIIRNFLVSGQVALTTTQMGQNIYYGNNLESKDPYYRPLPFASSSPTVQGIQFTIEASRRSNKKLTNQEASYYWTFEVLKISMEHPRAFLKKIIQKILVLFNRFEAGDHYHIGFMSNFVEFFKLPLLTIWLILPFGLAGMVTGMFKSRKLLSVSLIFICYASTLVLFFTTTRMRLPLLVILIPLAVSGIGEQLSSIRDKKQKNLFIYSSVAAAFFIIEFLPVQGTDDITAYYNAHAIILKSNGRTDEAVKYWEESSRMDKPFSAYANLSLAGTYLRKGDTQRAHHFLSRIPDHSFAAAHKYNLLGDMLMAQGETEEALEAYERSLEINSGLRRTRMKLVRILWRIDRQSALEEYDKYKYISSFYNRY